MKILPLICIIVSLSACGNIRHGNLTGSNNPAKVKEIEKPKSAEPNAELALK